MVLVETHGSDDKIDMFFHAAGRAAKAIRVGSLLAPRLHDVTLLADTEAPWDRFWARVVTELNGGCCRIGVGGRCFESNGFPNSWRVADLVAQGLSNRQVANRVFLSPHTVAFHLRHIFWKLGVTSRVQLARMAAEQGSLIGDGNIPSLGSSRLICASWRDRRT